MLRALLNGGRLAAGELFHHRSLWSNISNVRLVRRMHQNRRSLWTVYQLALDYDGYVVRLTPSLEPDEGRLLLDSQPLQRYTAE
jgi:hypothetical protein